ncbi:hypothetical protein Tco_0440322, partial [Tanacetum coccineum]
SFCASLSLEGPFLAYSGSWFWAHGFILGLLWAFYLGLLGVFRPLED